MKSEFDDFRLVVGNNGRGLWVHKSDLGDDEHSTQTCKNKSTSEDSEDSKDDSSHVQLTIEDIDAGNSTESGRVEPASSSGFQVNQVSQSAAHIDMVECKTPPRSRATRKRSREEWLHADVVDSGDSSSRFSQRPRVAGGDAKQDSG